jgi:hypothetical protein
VAGSRVSSRTALSTTATRRPDGVGAGGTKAGKTAGTGTDTVTDSSFLVFVSGCCL